MAVATLISLWLGYKREPEAGVIQAWAVFVAGFLQLALLMWGMHNAGMSLGLRWPRMTNDMRRLVQLGIPGVVSGGVTQINIAIGTIIASLEPGAVSQLYYADRVYELPLSIVGIAVGIVLLPDVARQLRAGNTAGVMDSQNRSLEFAMLLTVPAALALAVIPHDIVRVLFERGAFHAGDTAATASVLAMFALGLPAFVMIKVFSPVYFAREDTKTPMRYAVISLTANTVGSIVLFFVLRELGMMPQLGIAIATTLGGWLNAYLLWAKLRKHDDFIVDTRLRRNLPLIIIASVAMVGGLLATSYVLAPYLGAEARFFEKTAALAVEIGVGVSIFGLFILAFGVMSLRQLGAFMGRGSKA
jgi:putative peptidoglycan lipid II flippase